MKSVRPSGVGMAMLLLAFLGVMVAGSGCGSQSDPGTASPKPQAKQPALQGKPGIVEVLPGKKGGALGKSGSQLPPTWGGEIALSPEGATSAEKMAFSAMQARIQAQPSGEQPGPRTKFTKAEELVRAMEKARYNSGIQGMNPQSEARQGPKTKAEELTEILMQGQF